MGAGADHGVEIIHGVMTEVCGDLAEELPGMTPRATARATRRRWHFRADGGRRAGTFASEQH